ncbi:hypothetical protein C2845_PM16G07040 [Panicum miliaceum]|uniref:Uncharacterized protein n=1 Tax=Panicum miliaceum TaxID=4540 RepID=A0A3L6PS28_PANMI|nr:hypothetical protein C2845_PM16G07040 [Panicum miliaceum]
MTMEPTLYILIDIGKTFREQVLRCVARRFPYLVEQKPEDGDEDAQAAKIDWKIIEEDVDKPFVASGLEFVPLPSLDAIKRIRPKRALLIGMRHFFEHQRENQMLAEWSISLKALSHVQALYDYSAGIPVQLAHDGLRVSIDL